MTLGLILLLLTVQPTCQDVSSCREQAIAARDAGDFEAFHDLAWAAFNKGNKNDPELMLLVARAQSLSGRPGDALVMLERIAALGHATDAATSDDFARVRALARWPEAAAKLEAAPAAEKPAQPEPESASKKAEPKKPEGKKPEEKKPAPEAKKPEPEKSEPKKPDPIKPEREPKKPDPSKVTPGTKGEKAAVAEPNAPAEEPTEKTAPRLSFTTVLTPAALAYDAVSRRYIIADRRARRVAIVDEHTGQVSTLIGAAGNLGDIGGMAIDPAQGDLWLVSTGDDDAPSLHRVQLISGRVLSSVPLKRTGEPVALAFVRGAGLVLADNTGAIFTVDPSGVAGKIGALEYVPDALASDARGRLYISGGAARIGRYAVSRSLRRIDTIELAEDIPPGAPFAVTGAGLRFVVPVDGRFELRSIDVK